MTKRVLIVGAGIIGASFAFHLAEAGADVRVLDANGTAGGVATPNSWAWINASWGNAPDYFRLRRDAMAKWRDLDKRVPGLNINWCGGLLWDLPEAELRSYAAERMAQGSPIRLIGKAEAAKLEPLLKHVPELAVHVADEGVVEPVHAVERLLTAAKALGAEVLLGTSVRWLIVEKGRVTGVMTQEGPLEADIVVLAAGTSCKPLLKDAGIALALDEPPGLLVHTAPAPEMLNGLVMAPELHVRQTAEGRLVAGTDFTGADPGNEPQRTADELFAKLQSFIAGGELLTLETYTVGHRPTPHDGVSAIGFLPSLESLYLCV
ncbi:MAG: FAD-binding oxidoreductase, partial [Phyllobacteriaceae bacterium]|nr:FAD-binding oxidoreductase [Phyllobacteriaceae bacterium]